MDCRRMNVGTRVSALLTLILLSGCIFPAILTFYQGDFAGKVTPQAAADSPILVDGDDGWTSVPGITGDGSWGNPYVIKDKVIDAGGVGDGILIQNTTKYFTIRNCTVTHSASMPVAGIHLINATNGLIEQNNCTANGGGIFAEKRCTNITIRGNNATGNEYGIVVYDLSANVSVASNNASANAYDGIYVTMNCTAVRVENNTAVFNVYEGIITYDNVTFSTVAGNNASWNGYEGLYISETFNTTFANNQILGNQNRGVIIFDGASNNTFGGNRIATSAGVGLECLIGCKNNTFERNNFTGNTGVGIVFNTGGEGNLVYLNRFESNVAGNAKDDAAYNRWDNGSVGNFWHDYTGIDGNDDGIGDSAWTIPGASGSLDQFPLWNDGDNPIYISGEAGWVAFRSAGNCTGSGTQIDPYIIKSKNINAKLLSAGIYIENTSSYFSIQDCSLTNATSGIVGGITLSNVTNSWILNNNCSRNNGVGIFLTYECKNITIIGNIITNNTYGLVVYIRCNNNSIAYNNASKNTNAGIMVSANCEDNRIFGNNASDNSAEGIQLASGSRFTVVEGNIFNNNTGCGIVLSNSVNNSIINNNCTNNKLDGLYSWSASNNSISNNNFSLNRNGIYLPSSSLNNSYGNNFCSSNTQRGANLTAGSNGNCFYGNNFSSNGIGQGWDAGSLNLWYNGSVGNFWGDYAGVDANDDFIGDSFYTIPSSGAQDNYPIWDDGDDVAPVVTVTGLVDNQLYGGAAPSFGLTLADAYGVDDTWVSYDNGLNNHTCGVGGALPNWDDIGNGTIPLIFFANDTAGHVGRADITLQKDIEAPVFTSTGLTAGQLIGNNTPGFVLTTSEGNPSGLWWFSFDSSTTNTTCSQSDFLVGWNMLPNGTIAVRFFTNDTMGNTGWADVSLERDCAPPTITSTGLTAGSSFTSAPTFSLAITEANTQVIWYSVNGGATNLTLASLAGSLDAGTWANLPTGDVVITFWANDTLGNTASVTVIVVKTSSNSECVECGDPTLYYVIGGIIAVGAVVGIAVIVKKRKNRGFYPDEVPPSK